MKLPEALTRSVKRDPRYCDSIHRHHERGLKAARSYWYGKDIISEVTDGEFTVATIDMHDKNDLGSPLVYHITVKNSLPNYPVYGGLFMGWWEPDHLKYFGITEKQWYKHLSYAERSEIESALQLKLWTRIEFYSRFAEMYSSKEHDKWWWDEDGSKAFRDREDSIEAENEYWKNRLNME